MKGHEWGAIIAAFLVGVGLTAATIVWAGWLSGNEYVNALSNSLTLVAAPGLIVAVGFGAWRRWHCRCAVPGCVRTGEHEVADTVKKVCSHHHDDAHHLLCRNLWHRPGRLGWRR